MSIDGRYIDAGAIELALVRFVKSRRTQKRAAKDLGISQQYLCDVLKGRREISATLADQLGYERVVMFRKAKWLTGE